MNTKQFLIVIYFFEYATVTYASNQDLNQTSIRRYFSCFFVKNKIHPTAMHPTANPTVTTSPSTTQATTIALINNSTPINIAPKHKDEHIKYSPEPLLIKQPSEWIYLSPESLLARQPSYHFYHKPNQD